MSSPSDRDEALYLDDMLEFCRKAMAYAAPLTQDTLVADPMRYDAVQRNIELTREASTHVSAATQGLAPEVAWREMVGTRNRVAHGYLGIAPETAWSILSEDRPLLSRQLEALLARLPH